MIGLAAAWRVAGTGARVQVVDPAPGRGASWVAAGMLAPVGEAEHGEPQLARLRVAAAAEWPDFATDLAHASGMEVGFSATGSVLVAVDPSDRLVVEDLLELHRDLGFPVDRLSPSGCRALVPALSPLIRGGASLAADHSVDNRQLVAALLAACERAGVTFVPEQATRVVIGGQGSVRGVELAEGGQLVAEVVVLTAGAASGRIEGLPPGAMPIVRPVAGQILRLRATREALSVGRTVRGIVHGRHCYLVPRRDGSLVVGATSEERGFDTTVRAGAVHALLDDARTLVPGVDEYELAECQAGLRPGTPDNAPYVGWTDVPGLAVATGHYRNGILLCPLTALAIRNLVLGVPIPGPLAPFGPQRSSNRRSDRSRMESLTHRPTS